MAGQAAKPATAREVCTAIATAAGDELAELAARYGEDPRSSVQKALEAAARRLARRRAELERVEAMYATMRELGGDGMVLGVDEVGRGAVAGPLTVCALALPRSPLVLGVRDSKQLSAARRSELAEKIRSVALAIGICHVPARQIDELGMAACLRSAMAGAVANAGVEPDCVLIDGNPVGAHPLERTIVHGDAKVACIAAASIVAKVTRDEMMVEMDARYPGYHLAESKGYASPQHIAAIREQGLTPEHRSTFCQGFLGTGRLF